MLLGVAGLVPGDWKSIDGTVLDNVAEHGFKTVQNRPESLETTGPYFKTTLNH